MGIRTYKEWPCATGDSATYFVAAEVVAVNPPCLSEKIDRQGYSSGHFAMSDDVEIGSISFHQTAS